MEQYSQYLMWVKTKNNIFNNSSWEEEAFAEDIARGPLGGFIWPPRSYSCTFCRREFRSAQALGGHMNVHRRERAKLKQQQFLIQDDLDQNPQNPKNPKNPQNPKSLLLESRFSSGTVSSGITIGQENTLFDNSSDAKSCGTNLYLGFDGCDEDDQEMMNCKRQKMSVSPLVVGFVEDQVDLELRLAS